MKGCVINLSYDNKQKKMLSYIVIIITIVICISFYGYYRPNAYEIKMNDKINFYVKDKEEFKTQVSKIQRDLRKEFDDFKLKDKFTWTKVHIDYKDLTPEEDIKNTILENNKQTLKALQEKKEIEKLQKEKAKKASNNNPVLASKIKFLTPCEGTVTSKFGMRWGKMHKGIDIANVEGSPIHAALDGKVSYAGWMEGYGNVIKIQHNNGVETTYAHCKLIRVKSGEQVKRGQLIGDMGSTGRSTGPHIHFEIRINGVPQNPSNYI
ncbi:MAG: Murein hydrolase activator NlpD [Clostridium sp.]